MKYASVLAILFLGISSFAKGSSQTFMVTCPEPYHVSVTPQSGSWASYHYDADIPVDLPALGNTLPMEAEGDAASVHDFHAATWTDRTFLCLYNSGWEAIALFETKLDTYVEGCYFDTPKGHSSECTSISPGDCPMVCRLA